MYYGSCYQRDNQCCIYLYVLGYYTTPAFKTKYNFVYILTNHEKYWLRPVCFLSKNNLE